jgi:uncharacterized protein YndB with AHSA1/START domain
MSYAPRQSEEEANEGASDDQQHTAAEPHPRHPAVGRGVVRIEDRYDTDIDDLWEAITDPARLRRWYGVVEGDLRLGGEFRLSGDTESTGRIDACEPPQLVRAIIRETDESYQKGQGVPPFDEAVAASLTADGNQTTLVIEVKGIPFDKIAFYGVGWQIHAENLATYLAGREPADTGARWEALIPPYMSLAAGIQ